jgi:phosphatidylserine/phosphatidylglycerophosphate/cardiolipin synthase-like enzyme
MRRRLTSSASGRQAADLRRAVPFFVLATGCAPMTPAYTPATGTTADADAAPVEIAPADTVQAAKPLAPGDPVELVTNSTYLFHALDLINSATARLDVVQFETKPSDIITQLIVALRKARERKVTVRVLLDEAVSENAALIDELRKFDVSARLDESPIRTHAKLILADSAFLAGSTNWSTTSITKNNETNVLVRDDAARKVLGTWFDAMWKDAKKQHKITASTSTKVAVCYGDAGYFDALAPVIDAAKSRLDVTTYAMNLDASFGKDGPVWDAVKKIEAAVARKVKVRVLLDQSTGFGEEGASDQNKTAGAYLKKLGAEVRLDPLATITHAKFVVNDTTLIVGSNNWGYSGFVTNHEIGVCTSEAKAVADLQKYFDKIWATGTPL